MLSEPKAVTYLKLEKPFAEKLSVRWNFPGSTDTFAVKDTLGKVNQTITGIKNDGSDPSSFIGTITGLKPAWKYQLTLKACANNLCGKEAGPVNMTTCK